MQQLASVKEDVSVIRDMHKRLADIEELLHLEERDSHPSMEDELEEELQGVESDIDKLEFELSFSGPYDRNSAVVSLHAGAGGSESQDWAAMLMRMYMRWAEKRGYRASVLMSAKVTGTA